MSKELANGKPTTRGYSVEEIAAAVRMVRTQRVELGVAYVCFIVDAFSRMIVAGGSRRTCAPRWCST